MSSSYSDDDIQPGSRADYLLRRMGRRHLLSHSSGKEAHAMDPTNLEAQLAGAGVTSPFNTWPLEEALRQQASSAVDRRHHEIEAYEQALHGALVELDRVRVAEEARLVARVQEATRRFQQQIEALQQQYLSDVEKLKRQTVAELNKQRAQSEAAIAARMRVLQTGLKYDRPVALSSAVSPQPPVTTAPCSMRHTRDRSPGPVPSASKPHAHTIRMRSASSARAAAGAWDRPIAMVPFAAEGSPVAATPNRAKLELGEGLW